MPTIPESHRDLLDAPVAVLATNGTDGFPQVSALWFLFDGENLKLSLNNARQKVKNLSQHQSCTLFIMDPTNPYRTLEIRAQAELTTDEDYSFADELGKKYGGADLRAHDQPGQSRVVVTLKPIKYNTWGDTGLHHGEHGEHGDKIMGIRHEGLPDPHYIFPV